ncbi:glucose 1-dehydrogenase [Halobium salinum]|uniref:Glucose 1-dehydrogenase n=1 Tax=Halobium salinum TaxID=1364940 RepID=A0ABD5PAC9_9EURY|nr:glucose 1-dehydrogenase [Halobium salinum]
MSNYEFHDRVAVVTGGSTGIGRATAEAFAEAGAAVVIGDVNDEEAEATVESIRQGGGEATAVHADVTDAAAVAAMVETAVDEYGGLDFAFNNAGIGGEQAKTADYSEDGWQRVLDVNLTGVWRCMREQLPRMVEDGGGVVVNNASILGKVGFETAPAYVAAKHGLLGLTKTAALEYAGADVRVNAVCPGFVDTPLLEQGGLTTDQEMRGQIEGLHAMNRLGTPEEIADAVCWLCSDGASFTTGAALDVEGGYLSR